MTNRKPSRRGRPKGSHFTNITLGQLQNYIGNQGMVVVSKKWLDGLGVDPNKKALTHEVEQDKIEFTIND